MTEPMLIAFLGASFLLAVTPGPGVLYIVTRSLTQGRRSGMASVAGVALGNLVNALGAAIGLAAWFAVSSLAFTVTKYLGAAYLIYLGIRTLAASARPLDAGPLARAPLRRVFRDGFFVAALNPKTALFFAAFLPQFMGAAEASIRQSISLGCIFVLIAAATDTLYTFAAGAVTRKLHRSEALGRGASASVFIGLGLYTAFAGPPKP